MGKRQLGRVQEESGKVPGMGEEKQGVAQKEGDIPQDAENGMNMEAMFIAFNSFIKLLQDKGATASEVLQCLISVCAQIALQSHIPLELFLFRMGKIYQICEEELKDDVT